MPHHGESEGVAGAGLLFMSQYPMLYDPAAVFDPDPGPAWDDVNVTDPWVMRVAGTYYLFYSGRAAAAGSDRIGLATSPDGIVWTRHPANPILLPTALAWDDNTLMGPSVIYEGGVWYLYYSAVNNGDTARQCGLATAPNPWGPYTKHPANPIITVGAPATYDEYCAGWKPTVIKDGAIYYMVYEAVMNVWTNMRVAGATSPDRVTWTKCPNNPLLMIGTAGSWDDLDAGADPDLFKIGNLYFIMYGGTTAANLFRIGMAYSDVFNRKFTKRDRYEGIIIPPTNMFPGSFATLWINDPCVLRDALGRPLTIAPDHYPVYVAGNDTVNTSIGLFHFRL